MLWLVSSNICKHPLKRAIIFVHVEGLIHVFLHVSDSKRAELVSCRSFVYSRPLPRLWSDYQYGTNVALALSVICHKLVVGQVSCLSDGRAGAGSVHQHPRLYINSRRLILFGNESLYYWFWLRLYIRLQFVPHPSMSKAHYIKPTIHLRAVLTVCACMWVIL